MPVDPDAQRVLDLIKAIGRPPMEALSAAEARQSYANGRKVLQSEPQEVAEVRELDAEGVALRFYRPAGSAAQDMLPGLVFCHGGGWVVGDRDTHDGISRHLANAGRVGVVSVEYRLAPEHPFPAGLDDALAALRFVVRQAQALGLDPARIAVGGDSAGGNLAAVLAIMAQDGAAPSVAAQLLLYPAVDLRVTRGAALRFTEDLPLTTKTMQYFIDHYLGNADASDWRASPLRAPDLRGVAPAFVLTAGYDPLCDEGAAYAKRLESEGVPVISAHFAGQIHGFLNMGKFIRASAAALDMAAAALRLLVGANDARTG